MTTEAIMNNSKSETPVSAQGLRKLSDANPVRDAGVTGNPSAGVRVRSELETKREILSKRLRLLERNSLYTELGLTPACSEQAVDLSIASLRGSEKLGRVLSAEEKYAIQILGDPLAREQYDRKLLDILSHQEALPNVADDTRKGSGLGRLGMVVGLAVTVIGIGVALSFKADKPKPESASAAATATTTATVEKDEAGADRAVLGRAASTETLRYDVADRSARLAEQQQSFRERQFEEQVRLRSVQMEVQREQQEERKRQADRARELADRQRQERIEQESARRTVAETERELCITARRNNNPGAVMRWCK